MSTRRKRIVGTQAAAVAVLVLLVYVTLLRPTDPGALRGIEGPGGSRGETTGEPPDPGAKVSSSGPAGSAVTGVTGSEGRPGLLALEAFASSAVAGGAGPSAPPSGSAPVDDQYDDAAKALLEKVAGAG